MSAAHSSISTAAPGAGPGPPTPHIWGARDTTGKPLLFDLSGIDLSACAIGREELGRLNPHRGPMALLDRIVWHAPGFERGLGVKRVRHDEFWVAGHFPGRPMFPGVLMVETAAQLSAYLYNVRLKVPVTPAFIRIDECSFRSPVEPGDDLFLLSQDVKFSAKRFIVAIQGLVEGRLCFEATLTGMAI